MNNRLTREQAIEKVGLENVLRVEAEDCDFTTRPTNGTEDHGWEEFSSSIKLENGILLSAYYYQDEKLVEKTEELSDLEWEPHHYRVE